MLRQMILFAVLLFTFICLPSLHGDEVRVFKAGAAVVDITPTILNAPTQGNGYTVIADKIKDPLFARSLCLHDGNETILFLVIDVCWIRTPAVDRIKTLIHEKTGVPKDRIMVSTTHTHSAPLLRDPPSEGETKFTSEKVAQAGIEAYENLAPAKIGWTVGNDPKNVFCRRFQMRDGAAPFNPAMGPEHDRAMMNPGTNPKKLSPTGPVDSLIPMLSVVSPDGTPIAVFANYSCHHASQGLKPEEISGDRFGVFSNEMKRLVAEKVGKEKMSDKFVAIMAQGTSGDANCINFLDANRKFDYQSVGRENAEAAMVVWPDIEYFDWVPLRMTQRVIKVACYRPTAENIQAAKDYLADEKTGKHWLVVNSARSIAAADKWPETEDVPLQAMRIGEFGITTLPGEFFGITGIDLKAKSPFQPTMNIGLANMNFSYVPPPEQYVMGGYATWRSGYRCLGIDAEPLIKKTLLDMLHELAK